MSPFYDKGFPGAVSTLREVALRRRTPGGGIPEADFREWMNHPVVGRRREPAGSLLLPFPAAGPVIFVGVAHRPARVRRVRYRRPGRISSSIRENRSRARGKFPGMTGTFSGR